MSKTEADSDKLKRLLALALDAASADGEALNALKAARKLVTEHGGFDAALSAMCGAKARTNSTSGGFSGWQYRSYDPWGFDFMEWLRREQERREKAEAERKEAERKAKAEKEERRRQAAKEAKQTISEKLGISPEDVIDLMQAFRNAMKDTVKA